MQDRIEKTIDLKAPVARVWRALTDHKEFGTWFRVNIDGPFVTGEVSRGQMTHPGCEHMKWRATVKAMDAERLFSFIWCPLSDGADVDPSDEPHTLVEFKLEPTPAGTRLVISESGFSALPDGPRRVEVLRRNTEGWNGQVKNITAHVES